LIKKEISMKKSILVALVVVAFGSGTPSAQASGYLTPYSEGVFITRYHLHGGGGMTITVSGIANPDGCGGNSLVHIPSSLVGYKEMVATVLGWKHYLSCHP
jgi:hypothetical protein